MRLSRVVALLAAGTLSGAALSGCSSSSSDSAATPSVSPAETSAEPSPTQTAASASPTSDLCSEDAILAAIPSGSQMVRFDCADVSGTQWAAAEVQPGPTVFFLQASGDSWEVSTSDEICGTASAGLPPKLLDYCS